MMKLLRWTAVLTVAFALIGTSEQAHAQDAADSDATLEGDIEMFWAEQRRVRVLQRKLYETAGEFQLTLYVGAIPNDPFVNYFPLGMRFGYHLSESIALELSGAYHLQSNTDLTERLQETVDASVFILDEQIWRANLALLWSPLYGKFSFLGTKLAHFDWYLGLGAGVLGARGRAESDLTVDASSVKAELVILTGWNLHLHQRWALRLDYRQFIFQKNTQLGGVALPSELSLGASYFF